VHHALVLQVVLCHHVAVHAVCVVMRVREGVLMRVVRVHVVRCHGRVEQHGMRMVVFQVGVDV